jgi:hypothetical protein
MATRERRKQVMRHFARDTQDAFRPWNSASWKPHQSNRRSDHSRGAALAVRWFVACKGEWQKLPGRELMTVLAVFILFVALGDVAAVGICTLVERISESASLFAFLGLFVLVFIVAWKLAVTITERYLVRQWSFPSRWSDTRGAARTVWYSLSHQIASRCDLALSPLHPGELAWA